MARTQWTTLRGAALAALLATGCAAAAEHTPAAPHPTRAKQPGQVELEQAATLARKGDLVRAEQYLTAAARAGYPEGPVVLRLIRVCVAGDRYRAALRYALPYLARHPGRWQLRYLVATLHLALDQHGPALDELKRVARQHPDHPQAHYLTALILRDGGDLEGAAMAFGDYLRFAPTGLHAAEAQDWLSLRRTRQQPERRQP